MNIILKKLLKTFWYFLMALTIFVVIHKGFRIFQIAAYFSGLEIGVGGMSFVLAAVVAILFFVFAIFDMLGRKEEIFFTTNRSYDIIKIVLFFVPFYILGSGDYNSQLNDAKVVFCKVACKEKFTKENKNSISENTPKLDINQSKIIVLTDTPPKPKAKPKYIPTENLKSLSLTIKKHIINKDHNTTLKVVATYKDKTTHDYTEKINWKINPPNAVSIINNTLIALKDVNATIQAELGNIKSNPINISIYWEVDGHRLPPKPDPKINNSTLLGLDINNNGVRDDVERWIYEHYKEYKAVRASKKPIYIKKVI